MMLAFLRKHDLDRTKLRGQGYDDAGNTSGKIKGVATRIASQFPLADYTHRASHCLNLAVVSSFEEGSECNMIGVENRVSIISSLHILNDSASLMKQLKSHSQSLLFIR